MYLKLYAEQMYAKARKFVTGKDEGASMVEYALLLSLITVALVGVISTMGGKISTLFTGAGTALDTAGTAQGS